MIHPCPGTLVQRQITKLKCHFNFLQALVSAGLALSPGYSCKFHTVWCQKGYSPSISHSDLIHLSPLMCYSCSEVSESPYSLKGCQRRIITLLPFVSHMSAHTHTRVHTHTQTHIKAKRMPVCAFADTHTHAHTHTPSPGGKVTNFKRLDTCSHFPLLSLLLPLYSPISLSLALFCCLTCQATEKNSFTVRKGTICRSGEKILSWLHSALVRNGQQLPFKARNQL